MPADHKTTAHRRRRPDVARLCYGQKREYLTHGHASKDAKMMRRHRDMPVVAYRCQVCNCWHVGHIREEEAPMPGPSERWDR